MLKKVGAQVEINETIHKSPSVVGRLRGKRDGRVLQLAGHIDHIDFGHPKPQRKEGIISGRGSADMKNGLVRIYGPESLPIFPRVSPMELILVKHSVN